MWRFYTLCLDSDFLLPEFATKRCSVDGRWEGKVSGDYTTPQGWTNYTPCYTPEMLELFKKLYTGSEEAARMKLDIAEKTRTLEIVGFSVSLAALVISLAIFCHFRINAGLAVPKGDNVPMAQWLSRLPRDNRVKQRRAWVLLRWVTAAILSLQAVRHWWWFGSQL
ncbi:G-protein coupled receptor activity protein [Homalodisca vitripennis]|nr:G-protein coupled receptor activity protein [Homalodisca vitripennis]